jgi:hypothetical protein
VRLIPERYRLGGLLLISFCTLAALNTKQETRRSTRPRIRESCSPGCAWQRKTTTQDAAVANHWSRSVDRRSADQRPRRAATQSHCDTAIARSLLKSSFEVWGEVRRRCRHRQRAEPLPRSAATSATALKPRNTAETATRAASTAVDERERWVRMRSAISGGTSPHRMATGLADHGAGTRGASE